ncbi:MAG: TusE/DsrC/DsvC family sulfur relay protein [Candidatus Electrothrix sp.]
MSGNQCCNKCGKVAVAAKEKGNAAPVKKIYELFPSGPGKGTCKMAGMPKSTGCV